jgi:hypothetical protein
MRKKIKSPKSVADLGLFLIRVLFIPVFVSNPYLGFVGSLVQEPISCALTNIPDGPPPF